MKSHIIPFAAWLPGMTAAGDPVHIGDRIRADVMKLMKGG